MEGAGLGSDICQAHWPMLTTVSELAEGEGVTLEENNRKANHKCNSIKVLIFSRQLQPKC